MLGFVQGLGSAGHEVAVLSGAPEETFRLYGFTAIPRMDPSAVNQAIGQCDALIFPGGSIFQDVTSLKSVGYYGQLVKRAKSAGKQVFLVGQGVGPLTSFFGKRWASAAFDAADAIVVRDTESAGVLRELGVKTPIRVGADSAFLLPRPPENADQSSFQVGTMQTVGISARPMGKNTKVVAQMFADLTRLLFQANYMPVLIEMDREVDGPLIQMISKLQGGKVPDLRKVQTPMQLQQRLARMESVIAMRLHAGILATTVGVPAFMVSYDPKVSSFAKNLGLNTAPSIEGLSAQRLFENFQMFQRDRERNLQIVERKREEFSKAAKTNVEAVLGCLTGAGR